MTQQVKSTIQVMMGDKLYPIHLLQFNDGAPLVEFPSDLIDLLKEEDFVSKVINFTVVAHIKCSDGLVALPSVAQMLRQLHPSCIVHLDLPYLPHARQDRYTGNNSFTFKNSVVPIINVCNFATITVMDAHNPSMLSLFNALQINTRNLIDYVSYDTCKGNIDLIVAPDAGAVKNTEAYAKKFGFAMAVASKSRDPNTGHLVYNDIYGADVAGKNILIVDDLAEGGMTIKLLADLLKAKGAKSVHVSVTHGLFPRGFNHLIGPIDSIFAYYMWVDVPEELADRVTYAVAF
jgi:ribose-phosphate pyrophosphokinase